MTWTFVNAPDTSSTGGRRDAVRLLIPDITAASPLITDESIAFLLSESGNNVYRAAAHACRALGSANAGTAMSVGDLSISGLADSWGKKAKRLDVLADMGAAPYAGGITVSDKETDQTDSDIVQPFFTRTQDDIPGGPSASTGST